MKDKTKIIKNEFLKAKEKFEETQRLLEESQKEETDLIENLTQQIGTLEKENDVFCGVILGTEDIISIFQLAMKTHESIKIPFRIYINP